MNKIETFLLYGSSLITGIATSAVVLASIDKRYKEAISEALDPTKKTTRIAFETLLKNDLMIVKEHPNSEESNNTLDAVPHKIYGKLKVKTNDTLQTKLTYSCTDNFIKPFNDYHSHAPRVRKICGVVYSDGADKEMLKPITEFLMKEGCTYLHESSVPDKKI
jgi:hypothetical protein